MKPYSEYFSRIRRHIGTRAERSTDDHVAPRNEDKDIKALRILYQEAFGHHVRFPLPASEPSSLQLTNSDAHRLISTDNLSKTFLSNYFTPPTISETDSHDPRDQDHATCSLDHFIRAAFARPFPLPVDPTDTKLGSNRISYLIADVGEGKSAFLTKALHEAFTLERTPPINTSEDATDEPIPIAVYVDIERYLQSGSSNLPPIDEAFFADLYKTIRRAVGQSPHGASAFEDDQFYKNPTTHDAIECISDLSHYLARRGYRIVLVIDNLDRYHFYYSSYSFFDQYYAQQNTSVRDNLHALIDALTDGNKLYYAGLAVVIACRTYFYELARQLMGPTSPSADDSTAYQITGCSEREIVARRISLFREAVDLMVREGRNTGQLAGDMLNDIRALFRFDALTSAYENGESDEQIFPAAWRAISVLCHHGHRSFVDFLVSLNLNYRKYELVDRLLRTQPIMLLVLYITAGKKRFTEKNEHFPNLFLNDCLSLNRGTFPEAHHSHIHTYWLRYLILRYLEVNSPQTGEEILYVFSTIGGFEDHLVRYTMGTLASSNEFSCIEVEAPVGDLECLSRNLRLSERGRYLLEPDGQLFHGDGEPLCFSFLYLQLVVDDPLLAIPTPWAHKIANKRDYGYIYEPRQKYNEEARKMVAEKVQGVAYFLRILEGELNVRRERQPEFFALLDRNNASPDIETIYEGFLSGIARVGGAMGEADTARTARELVSELRVSGEFEEFYRAYFNAGVGVR